MKKFNRIILLLVLILNMSFSQTKVEYDIYLIFSSEEKEFYVKDFDFENKTYKFFTFSKVEKSCKPSYSLSVNGKGKVSKSIKGTASYPCCNKVLFYNPTMNEKKKILMIEPTNKIYYKDFMDVSFENFSNILKDAQKVYVIDSSNKENEGIYYVAYEVTYK